MEFPKVTTWHLPPKPTQPAKEAGRGPVDIGHKATLARAGKGQKLALKGVRLA
jgi:hypothetical protein